MAERGGAVLLVDDDAFVRSAVRRALAAIAEVTEASTLAEARARCDERPWSAFVIDVALPDGCGLDWLEEARRAGRAPPALVITGTLDRAVVNRAFALGALYACKPFPLEALDAFAREASSRAPTSSASRASSPIFAHATI